MVAISRRLLKLALIIGLVGWIPGAYAETVVLRGATVIDVVAGESVRNAVIVIEGDKIAAFGDSRTRYPSDATIVDLKGKYIIPGLVNSHSHYQPFLGELYLNYGVTSVLAFSSRDDYGGPAYWDASMESDVRTPRLFGTGSVRLARNVQTREEARAAVEAFVKGGPDFALIGDYKEPNKQRWALLTEALHEKGIAVLGHTSNAAQSIPLGQDVIEHTWGLAQGLMTPQELENYRRGQYLHWSQFLEDEAGFKELVQQAVANGVYLNPTLVYTFGGFSEVSPQYETLIRELHENENLMSYYPQNFADGHIKKLRAVPISNGKYSTHAVVSQMSQSDLAELKKDYELFQRALRLWVDGGGKLVGGVDDPFVGTSGISAHQEMAMMVEAGLTPMQALRSMTLWSVEWTTARRDPATLMPVGWIGEGAYADLVILTENPLSDIDNTRSIEQVMKGGKFVTLGYTPTYNQGPPVEIRAMPIRHVPELTALTPHTVEAGSPAFEMVVEGNGFLPESIVRIDGVAAPTEFVSTRELRVQVPAAVAAAGQRSRFTTTGLDHYPSVFGDHSSEVTVFTQPPDGGTSNGIFLRVQEPWFYEKAHSVGD